MLPDDGAPTETLLPLILAPRRPRWVGGGTVTWGTRGRRGRGRAEVVNARIDAFSQKWGCSLLQAYDVVN